MALAHSAGQPAGRQRTPHEHPEAVLLGEGQNLAFCF